MTQTGQHVAQEFARRPAPGLGLTVDLGSSGDGPTGRRGPYHVGVSTIDHKARHVWARTPAGIRCAYMWCNARAEPATIARLEGAGAQRRTMRIEVRFSH